MQKIKIIGKILLVFIIIILFKESKVFAETDYTLEESIAYAMSLLDDNMTEHEKAFILAQYCQEGNIYNLSTSGQTATDVLVNHEAVCGGYSKAFKMLCNRAGLVCDQIIARGANHAFNICYLDGEWCYVDVTQGMSADQYPQCFYGEVFTDRESKEFVTAKMPNGSTTQTSEKFAKEQGWEIIERKYFNSSSYYASKILNYFPDGVKISSNFHSNFSRIYYDENYKYYSKKELNTTDCAIYRENRTNGTVTKLVDCYASDQNRVSGMVKDNNKIYYIGKGSGSIYSMDLNGNNKKEEFKYTGDKILTGIYVQDGYIYYTLCVSSTSRETDRVKWKKMETSASSNSYVLNNTNQKYKLNYAKSAKGIVITSCEGINGNEPEGQIYVPDTIERNASCRDRRICI